MCVGYESSLCLYFTKFLIQHVLSNVLLFFINFLRYFSFTFCFLEFGPLLSHIKTKPQLSFAASVLKDVTNFLPIYFSTLWSLLLWETGFSNNKEIFPSKKQRVLPFTYNPMIFRSSVVLHLI